MARKHRSGDPVSPHSIVAESCVLGAVLVSPGLWPTVSDLLGPDDYFRDAHRKIHVAIGALVERSAPVEPLSVAEELRSASLLDDVGGIAYLLSITNGVPKLANVAHFAGIVKEHARLRSVIGIAQDAIDAAHRGDSASDVSERASKGFVRVSASADRHHVSARAAMEGYLDGLLSGKEAAPIPTGYSDFDRIVVGFRPADFVVVAARPSVGKTAWGLGAARNMARRGHVVPFFSLEMPARQIGARLVSIESGVSSTDIERGTATPEQYQRVAAARDAMPDIPLLIQCSATTVDEIASWCRRMKQERGSLGCVFVDYLQLLTPERRSSDKEQEAASVSRDLKQLAKDLDVALVVLSQLNRAPEGRRDKRPHPSDIRGSGSIEQDADLIVALFREEMHVKRDDNAGVAEVIVAKQRNGPTGTVKMRFNADLARYENLARDEDDVRVY